CSSDSRYKSPYPEMPARATLTGWRMEFSLAIRRVVAHGFRRTFDKLEPRNSLYKIRGTCRIGEWRRWVIRPTRNSSARRVCQRVAPEKMLGADPRVGRDRVAKKGLARIDQRNVSIRRQHVHLLLLDVRCGGAIQLEGFRLSRRLLHE